MFDRSLPPPDDAQDAQDLAQQIDFEGPARPCRPCAALPASPEKVAVLIMRASGRRELFNRDDARLDDEGELVASFLGTDSRRAAILEEDAPAAKPQGRKRRAQERMAGSQQRGADAWRKQLARMKAQAER